LNDPDEDEEIKASIYTWWHQDLPSEIKEGFLNEEDNYQHFMMLFPQ
jgi:hypothetical protein